MSELSRTEIVELRDGTQAYVTFEDENGFLRVTPIDGDPLCSFEIHRALVRHIGYKEHG